MRFLVGAACVAIIAFVAYFFVDVYRSHQAGIAAAERQELFFLAAAKPEEEGKVRQFCKQIADGIVSNAKSADWLETCRRDGYL